MITISQTSPVQLYKVFTSDGDAFQIEFKVKITSSLTIRSIEASAICVCDNLWYFRTLENRTWQHYDGIAELTASHDKSYDDDAIADALHHAFEQFAETVITQANQTLLGYTHPMHHISFYPVKEEVEP